MTSLKDLLIKQEDLIRTVEQKAENLFKLNKQQRTKVKLTKEWSVINELWMQIQIIHKEINDVTESKEGPYFNLNVFDHAQETIEKAKKFILQLFPEILQEQDEDDQNHNNDDEESQKDQDEDQEDQGPMDNKTLVQMFLQGLNQTSMNMAMLTQDLVKQLQVPLLQQVQRPQTNEIPLFDGKIKDFGNFKAIFETIVGTSKISDIEKLAILRSKLKGDALKLINHLQITDENYANAWKLLKSRYEDKRSIIGSEIETLINLPVIKSSDPTSLSSGMDITREIIYNLKSMGVNTESCNPFITHMIIRKMDSETRRYFELSLIDKSKLPTILEVDEFLEKTFKELRMTKSSHNQKKSVFETLTQVTTELPKIKCLICNENHFTIKCLQLKNANDKEKLLREKKICVYCACHKYAYGMLCRKKINIKCEICKENHLTLLHPTKKILNKSLMQEKKYGWNFINNNVV
jgi:hypothetical protein